jgi:hypothetical protein
MLPTEYKYQNLSHMQEAFSFFPLLRTQNCPLSTTFPSSNYFANLLPETRVATVWETSDTSKFVIVLVINKYFLVFPDTLSVTS